MFAAIHIVEDKTMNRNKIERIISELPNVLKWNTSTRGHKESTKIESNSLECNGTMYVIKIDGDTCKYDLSAVGVSDTSHEWIVQLEGLEYGTDIFYYLHDRAAQEANSRSDFKAEPSERIANILPAGFIVENGMQGKTPSILVDGNPKTQFGVAKPPAWYVPFTAVFMTGLAHMHGALKYGHFNWRDEPMSTSTLINAALRHISAYKEGEDCAQDSGCSHLAHAAACLNILMDAEHHECLNDDRHASKTHFDKLFKLAEPVIKQVTEDAAMMHASKPTNNEDK